MGQYYLAYVNDGKKEKVFDNVCDGDYNGLKLMEHSWWANRVVANVVNELYYHKAFVAWVGDYYAEDNYSQVNCNDESFVKMIGDKTWDEKTKRTPTTKKKVRFLTDCLLVNHSKKQYLDCNEYWIRNKHMECWNEQMYEVAIHPLPLLTCSANHSGGSYYGINKDKCGTWFYDQLEVVLDEEKETLDKAGYKAVMFVFEEGI